MRGVLLQKATLVGDDHRRTIHELINGMTIKNVKIIHVKGAQVLADHWHSYPEFRYMLDGEATFDLKHVITGETETVLMQGGDILFVDAFVKHVGKFARDSVVVEGAGEMYLHPKYNDHPENT